MLHADEICQMLVCGAVSYAGIGQDICHHVCRMRPKGCHCCRRHMLALPVNLGLSIPCSSISLVLAMFSTVPKHAHITKGTSAQHLFMANKKEVAS